MVDSTSGKLDRQKSRADERLFRHLGKAHHLSNRELELLTALADEHELVRLSEIFVRPSLIDTSPDDKRWTLDQVATLHHKLTVAGPSQVEGDNSENRS